VDNSGNVYFSESEIGAIGKWSQSTQQASTLASGLSNPYGVAVNLAGNVFFSNQYSNSIGRISATTQQLTTLTATGLTSPTGIAVDLSGNVYIADFLDSAIKKLPMMYVSTASVTEPATAGSDTLPPVYPTNLPITATSDRSWLTIGTLSNGVVNFSFSANTTGALRVAHITVLGQSITVTQLSGAQPRLMFASQPVNTAVGSALPPFTVPLLDSNGNVMTGSSASVNVTSSPSLVSSTVNAMNGIATFSGLVFNTPGTYTLSATSAGLTSATSNSFNITSSTYRISGQASVSGAGVGGVTINVTGSQTLSTTTDASGNYNFSLAGAGTYTLSASLSGDSFSPPITLSNLSSNQTANFTGIAVTNSSVAMFSTATNLVPSAMTQGAFQGNPAVSIGAQTNYWGATTLVGNVPFGDAAG